MGKGKKNVVQEGNLKKHRGSVGPLDGAEERCERFANGMLSSFYLYSLNEMLDLAEAEGEMDSLEVRVSLQIVIDTLLEEEELPN